MPSDRAWERWTKELSHHDGERIDSTSTLRFRTREALEFTLAEAGFTGLEVRDLPYAPVGAGW